jgi:hypothetical protein
MRSKRHRFQLRWWLRDTCLVALPFAETRKMGSADSRLTCWALLAFSLLLLTTRSNAFAQATARFAVCWISGVVLSPLPTLCRRGTREIEFPLT